MPRWDPTGEMWRGTDAYVIGGGTSLRSFQWDLIAGKNTIGCNSSGIAPGYPIVQVCLWADIDWWRKIGRKGLAGFKGLVIGAPSRCVKDEDEPWLKVMDRHPNGREMGEKALGVYSNTGAMAINLALILGAQRVFLLGFDMHLGKDGSANYHDLRWEPSKAESYPRFLTMMRGIKKDVQKTFPGREVYNVTDDSNLNEFPKVSLAEHFKRKMVTA